MSGPHSSSQKWRSISILMLAEIAGMSLWFMSAAILPDLTAEYTISSTRQAALSSAVQAGFVVGAILLAVAGLPDRFDPRRLFAACAILAACANAALLVVEPGGNLAITCRFLTGILLAGVYPVGLKIAVGWGEKDRGFLTSILVGALTFGSATPHLITLLGGADWRVSVAVASAAAFCGGLLCLATSLGPYHVTAKRFSMKAISTAWTNRKVRLAYTGYLGHMWELYAMWAWIGLAAAVSFRATMSAQEATDLGRLLAFCTIATGGVASMLAGFFADRAGKENTAIWIMTVSGCGALATAASFGGPAWITIICTLIWGAAILPDSAQFSALVADHSPPGQAGSLMTFQTALGFALTFFTVQAAPLAAQSLGWPAVFVLMAIGPLVGIAATRRLKRLTSSSHTHQ